jgi:hypothetical protein
MLRSGEQRLCGVGEVVVVGKLAASRHTCRAGPHPGAGPTIFYGAEAEMPFFEVTKTSSETLYVDVSTVPLAFHWRRSEPYAVHFDTRGFYVEVDDDTWEELQGNRAVMTAEDSMGCVHQATRDAAEKKMVVLTCSCCGGQAPAFAQWHNRDRGYGLCGRCAAWIRSRTRFYDPGEFLRCYGEEGIHWIPLATEGG